MVAVANYRGTFGHWCSIDIRGRKCVGTIYLHFILTGMNKEKISETMLTITVGFVILYMVFKYNAFLYTASVIGLIGVLSPYLSSIVAKLWFKLAELLGLVIPKILLSLVFFVFLYPVSLLAKMGRKDQLMLGRKYDSYFVTREKRIEKSDFEKTW
jgi:hypothetical protein